MNRWLFFLVLLIVPALWLPSVRAQSLQYSQEDRQENFNLEELFQQGNRYFESEDYFSAAELYRKILTFSPKALEARFNLAHTYYRIYETDPKEGGGYLGLTIYTYEQILEGRGGVLDEVLMGNGILSHAATNLSEIRSGYDLKSVSRGYLDLVIATMTSAQKIIIHGMGVAFVFAVLFLTSILLQPNNSLIKFFRRKKSVDKNLDKKEPQQDLESNNLKGRILTHVKAQLPHLFVIALTGYLLFLGLWLWERYDFSGIPTRARGVIPEEIFLRKVSDANSPPFARISEGETVSIIETAETNTGRTWVKIMTSVGEGWVEASKVWVIDPYDLPILTGGS